jgi:hypothetical protein
MILSIVHDDDGNIIGATAQPEGMPPSGPTPNANHRLALVEVADPPGQQSDAVFDFVLRTVENSRIELKDGKAVLAMKEGSTAVPSKGPKGDTRVVYSDPAVARIIECGSNGVLYYVICGPDGSGGTLFEYIPIGSC